MWRGGHRCHGEVVIHIFKNRVKAFPRFTKKINSKYIFVYSNIDWNIYLLHQNIKCAGANQQAQGMSVPSSASPLAEGKPSGMCSFK
jgi:hypothetical protein